MSALASYSLPHVTRPCLAPPLPAAGLSQFYRPGRNFHSLVGSAFYVVSCRAVLRSCVARPWHFAAAEAVPYALTLSLWSQFEAHSCCVKH